MSRTTLYSSIGSGLGLLLLAIPLFITAQDTGTNVTPYCPNLTVTMQRCDVTRPLSSQRCTDTTTGGQVTELQKFLSDYYDLDPATYVTGYFGRLTKQNVQRFQCEKMSICSGDEATTGWGVVGPRTRAAIAQACGTGGTTNYSQSIYYSQATYTTNTYSQSSYTANLACTLDGATVLHGATRTFYSQRIGSMSVCAAASLARTCTNGTLSGFSSYQYASCSVQTSANFTATPTSGPAPLAVTFSANNLAKGTHYITFGDNTEAQMPTVFCNGCNNGAGSYSGSTSHTYTAADTYTARLSYAPECPTGVSCTQVLRDIGTVTISVTAPSLTLSTDKAAYTAGDTMRVTWNNPSTPGIKDWIAMVKASQAWLSTPNLGQGTTWQWINGVSGGFANLIAPEAAGSYQVIYFNNATDGAAATSVEKTRTTSFSVAARTQTVASVSSCTYKGQSYAEGQSVTVVPGTAADGTPILLLCDNETWVYPSDQLSSPPHVAGQAVCGSNAIWAASHPVWANLGCAPDYSNALLAVVPRHGKAPLSITVKSRWSSSPFGYNPPPAQPCPSYVVYWGDGMSVTNTIVEQFQPGGPLCMHPITTGFTNTHTYVSPGSYTVSYTSGHGRYISATIRVDSAGTASANNSSQLANALSALESALQSILKLLR